MALPRLTGILALILVSLADRSLPAQVGDQELKRGQQVRVLMKNGHIVKGRIRNITKNSLVLRVEGLGSTVQKLADIERISDAKSGAQLAWKKIFDVKKPKPAPTITKPTGNGTTKPTGDQPPTEPTSGAPTRSDKVKQAEAVLAAWQKAGGKDVKQLWADLTQIDSSPAVFVSRHMKSMPSKLWATAGQALVSLGDRKAVKELSALLTDKRVGLRREAVRTLTILAPTPDPYLPALRDSDADVRTVVVHAIGQRTDATYLSLVGEAIVDASPKVRRVAAGILADKASALNLIESAVSWVADGLDSTDPDTRTLCISTLGRLGTDAAVPALEGLLSDGDVKIRQEAVRALGRIPTLLCKRVLRDAIDAADDGDPQGYLIDLLNTVKRVNSREAIPGVIILLDSDNPSVVKRAHQTLMAMGNNRLPADSALWNAWWEKLPDSAKVDRGEEEEQP